MSTFLALDWERNRVHLVVGNVGNRGAVHLSKALNWDEEDLVLGNAEAAGKRFAKRLKDENITPGPVLGCLGRERVVLKEIRIPIVGAAEEPAIVRFQAGKELTEAPETVVIDYTSLHGLGGDGERRALLLVARRAQIEAYKKFCQSAGLKLAGITPRPFAIAAALKTAAEQPQRGLAVAILSVSERWAEFAVVGGKQLLFARSVALNGNVLGEVRRNLAVYSGQPVHSSRDAVQALYVTGSADQPLLRELQNTLAIPVHPLDPLGTVPSPGSDRAGFAGAAGLLHAWADGQQLPINFVAPKQPKPVVNTSRQKLVLAGAGGILCLIAMFFVGQLLVSARSAELDEKKMALEQAENSVKRVQPESKQIAALSDWQKSALPIIDELYDLTARFPFRVGFHLEDLSIAALPNANPKEPHSVRIMLTGNVPKGEVQLVQQLIDTINRDKHCRAALVSLREATAEGDDTKTMERFSIRVDVGPQAMSQFTTKLPSTASTSTPAEENTGKSRSGRRPFGGGTP